MMQSAGINTNQDAGAADLILTVEDPFAPHCVKLVEASWREMAELYGDDGPCRFKPGNVAGPRCVFVVAWLGGAPVGCGAIRPYEGDEGEVKRVFVDASARNGGVARRIMLELETRAVELGYSSLRLETGTLQPFAIRLYERLGYTRITTYGEYIDDPRSVCYGRTLR